MTGVTVIPSGAGEVVGDAPDRRVEILSEHDALHATWTRFGPRRDGADLHVHRGHTDCFYVLAGVMTVRLGADGAEVPAPAGTLARVPPLVVHGFRNAAEAELRYLNLHAPGAGFAAYMRGLRDGRAVAFDMGPPPGDGGRPVTEAVVGGTGAVADVDGAHVALLADVDELAVAEVSGAPGGAPPRAHVHGRHVESLFVLDGALEITAGDRELHAAAGSWVHVPPGAPHAVAAGSSAPARYLELHAPNGGFGAFVRGEAAGFDSQPAP